MALDDKLTPAEEAELRQMQADDLASAAEESQRPVDDLSNPPPPPVAEPESAQEPKAAVEDDDLPIPKKALFEERERRRKAEEKLQEIQVKQAGETARISERLELLQRAAQEHVQAQQPKAPEVPAPDPSTDPMGFITHKFQELERREAEQAAWRQRMEAQQQQVQQRSQQDQQRADLHAWGMGQEAEFAAQQTDYQQAVTHLQQARVASIRAMGITNPAEINQQLEADVLNSAAFARQRGIPFGKMLYDLAQANGYRPGSQAAPAASAAPSAAAAPALSPVSPVAASSPAERLIRGQEMAQTIGSTGAAPRGEAAPQAIASMSDAEFARIYENVQKNGAQAMRNLFGA